MSDTTTIYPTMKPEIEQMDELLTAIGTVIAGICDTKDPEGYMDVINVFIQTATKCIESKDPIYLDRVVELTQFKLEELQYHHRLAVVFSQFSDRFVTPYKYIINQRHTREDFDIITSLSNSIVALEIPLALINDKILLLGDKCRELNETKGVDKSTAQELYFLWTGVIQGFLISSGLLGQYREINSIAHAYIELSKTDFDIDAFNEAEDLKDAHLEEEGKRILELDEFEIVPHELDSPFHPDNLAKSDLGINMASPNSQDGTGGVYFGKGDISIDLIEGDTNTAYYLRVDSITTYPRGYTLSHVQCDEVADQTDITQEPLMTDEEHEEMCEDFLEVLDQISSNQSKE